MKRRDAVPELHVERLRLGELSSLEAARVRERLARAGELGRLHVPDEPGFSRMPDDLRDRIARAREREALRRRHASRGWALAVTAASFATMALVLALPTAGLRDKGGGAPSLVVYRQLAGEGGHEALGDGASARPGDLLQLGYRTGGARAVAIYSIDGRGVVTTHLAPTRGAAANERRLPTAFRLDDAPGFERFLLVTGDELAEDPLVQALRTLAARPDARTAPLAGPWRVVSLTLDKAPP